MEKGTQIAYIPSHANGNINHPDVEFGFVISETANSHYCRYWKKGNIYSLRTKANSELTPNECLVKHRTHPQYVVDGFIKELGL